jgi:hypothetical protein
VEKENRIVLYCPPSSAFPFSGAFQLKLGKSDWGKARGWGDWKRKSIDKDFRKCS